MVRTLLQDQRKNKRDVQRIIENKILCDVPGCDELISLYRGPYSDTKCRDHQLQGIEYGGNASANRTYTYHKLDHCEDCGWTPYTDPYFKLEEFESEHDMKRCQDKMLTVDHINGNHDDNREENCQTLCDRCHKKKSHINKDWLTSS